MRDNPLVQCVLCVTFQIVHSKENMFVFTQQISVRMHYINPHIFASLTIYI